MPVAETALTEEGLEITWERSALELEGVTFSYPTGEVLRGVTFRLRYGEVCSVLGNNGAGKTTLLRCILNILEPTGGVVMVEGACARSMRPAERAKRVGYVPQRHDGFHRLTVFEAVLLGRKPYVNWSAGRRDLEVVESVLDRLDLSRLSLRYTDEISGGELQKVLIARALAQEPRILLLDEPTSNLDLRNQVEVMEILRSEARRSGLCVLSAIHDINLALRYSDKFVVLKGGVVHRWGGPEVVTEEVVEEAYGVKVKIHDVEGVRCCLPVTPGHGRNPSAP
ncbi:MAG: ABC transporter ATP-binding protein [Candidatus Geothermincolales bacterium]